jgi:hypothetical protein
MTSLLQKVLREWERSVRRNTSGAEDADDAEGDEDADDDDDDED